MTVEEMLQLVPEEKREEAKQTIEGLNPLNSLQDVDSAVSFMDSNDLLKRAKDKVAQQAAEANKRRFEEERLPELRKQMRDELAKELNPEETPEQKRLRELEEQIAERDRREQLYKKREQLRAKGKELGFDEELAERFAYMQTDNPESELETFAERMQKLVESQTEQRVAERWPNRKPQTSGSGVNGKITRIEDVPKDWSKEDIAKAMENGTIQWE